MPTSHNQTPAEVARKLLGMTQWDLAVMEALGARRRAPDNDTRDFWDDVLRELNRIDRAGGDTK